MCAAAKNQIQKHQLKDIDQNLIHRTLVECGYDPKCSSKDILSLSDLYNREQGSPKVWEQENFVSAYMNYFFPLNSFRLQRILDDALKTDFFSEIENVWEFGSGPGTVHFNYIDELKHATWIFDEASITAQNVHIQLNVLTDKPEPQFQTLRQSPPAKTLGLFSYSICEDKLPIWASQCEALLILEPSTQHRGRGLMQIRQELINKGFYVWAPCTHQSNCPLLLHAKHDWCHMRSHFAQPQWFSDLEKQLPMKNHTLTYSYLLAKKTPPKLQANLTRVIGDTLYEKGKTRQAVCRSSDREFLSWLKRYGEAPQIEHGRLIMLKSDIEKKGDELRITSPEHIQLI